MSKIDDLIAAQARVEQQLIDLISTYHAHRDEQRILCEKHYSWTTSVQKRVDDLNQLRWYFRGISAIMAASFVYFKEEIKRKMGVKP